MSANSNTDGNAIHSAFPELMKAAKKVYGYEAPWNINQNPCRDETDQTCCSMEMPYTSLPGRCNVLQDLCVDSSTGKPLPKCNWNNIICGSDGHITGLGLMKSDFGGVTASMVDVGDFRLDLLPKSLEVLELAPYWFSGINTFSQYNTAMFPSLRRLSLQLHTDLNKVIDSIQGSKLECLDFHTPGYADFTTKATINVPSTLKEFSFSCASWNSGSAWHNQVIKGEIPTFGGPRTNLSSFIVRHCPFTTAVDHNFMLDRFGPVGSSKLQWLTLRDHAFDGSAAAGFHPSMFQTLPQGLKVLRLAGGKNDPYDLDDESQQGLTSTATQSTASTAAFNTSAIWKDLPRGLEQLSLGRFDLSGNSDNSWKTVDWKSLPSTLKRFFVWFTDIRGGLDDGTASVFTSGNLKELMFAFTKLSGPVDWSVIGKLDRIDFWSSSLSGTVAWNELTTPSYMDLEANSFTGSIDLGSIPGGIPTRFWLSSNDFSTGQQLSGPINIKNCTDWTWIGLNDLQLKNDQSSEDEFDLTFLPECPGGKAWQNPSWAGSFEVSRNNFTGSVKMRENGGSNQLDLWLSENQLSGEYPWNSVIDDDVGLALNGNKFEGTVDWTTVSKLPQLDLWDNKFTGTVEWWVLQENWKGYSGLKLNNNQFTGTIDWVTLLANKDSALTYVNLANNSFTGPVVDMAELPRYMREIDVSGNLLQGTVDLAKVPYGLVDLRLKQRGDICFTSPEAVGMPNMKKFFAQPASIQWQDMDRIIDPEQDVETDLTREYIDQNLCNKGLSALTVVLDIFLVMLVLFLVGFAVFMIARLRYGGVRNAYTRLRGSYARLRGIQGHDENGPEQTENEDVELTATPKAAENVEDAETEGYGSVQ